METIADYVIRKLNEPHTNISAICNTLKVNRSRIYRLMQNKSTANHEFVQKLHDYFRKLAE